VSVMGETAYEVAEAELTVVPGDLVRAGVDLVRR